MYLFIIFIIVPIAYIAIRRRILIKESELLNTLLYVEKNPQKYIDEVDMLIMYIQPEKERNINLIQKSTGLFYKGEFDEVIKILQEHIKKIPPNWQHIYYHNLILSLYFKNENEKAKETLKIADESLSTAAKLSFNKLYIESIYAFSEVFENNGSSRRIFLEDLAENGKNDYRKALGYYFLSKIDSDETKKIENLEKAKLYGKGSFIERINDED